MDLDRESESRESADLPAASADFSSTLFRQPALAEGRIRPAVYRKPGARSSLDVFGSSSRPVQTSQRRSVDGDFEVYDDEEKGEFRSGRPSLYQESSVFSEETAHHWRSPRQSVLMSAAGTESLREGLLTRGGLEGGSQSGTDDERLNVAGSDDGSDGDEERNVELELELDEILSTDERAAAGMSIHNQQETVSLSNTILSHISPSKKALFK